MALFLRGNIWWMEYRTRKVRKVVSTGLSRDRKADAPAAYAAFRLGMGARPKRSAMEGILSAIYGGSDASGRDVPLSAVWRIYSDWCAGKGRKVAPLTETNRRNLVGRFVGWAADRGLSAVSDVTVPVAREFLLSLDVGNKTQRTYSEYLSGMWSAVEQMSGPMPNPWKAARPDDDGSSVRREAFTVDEERRVLQAAREVGHGWYLASVIARWTGLRYGDVARLDWSCVDMERRVITLVPSKTRKHRVAVLLPMARALYDALEPCRDRTGFVLPEHALHYPAPLEPSFSVVLERAGVVGDQFTFHSWRHTFRTRLAEAGVSDDLARRLGGWTNLNMAAHYDHAQRLAELRSAIDAAEGVDGSRRK